MSVIAKLLLNSVQKSYVFRCFSNKAIKTHMNENTGNISVKTFGQPTHDTHPYLIKADEITPLIKKVEYQERRTKLMNNIASYMFEKNLNIKHHLIVIPSASKKYMSDKIPYIFRQNTEFLYLTGCQEPDSCIVLTIGESSSQHNVTLFMRPKDDHSELWDGPRTGPENSSKLFGVDQSLNTNELENYLYSYSKSNKTFSLWYDFTTPVQNSVHNIMCNYLTNIKDRVWESPKSFIHKLRIFKSDVEIELMQKSCDIAAEAIIKTIQISKPGINEHQLLATIDYETRMKGADYLAYPPVIAGGNRANIIHYINNNQIINDGDMVLMDAGCEYHGYSSDITRTWPISGKFNQYQLQLYEVILEVQTELIGLCKNFPTLDYLFDSMCYSLGRKLQEIGIISKQLNKQSLMRAAYLLCPHHVSHYLGMDVHDTPLIGRNIQIQPRMIITMEPGIYVNHKNTQVPKEFRGFGIRIEDDILITENGPVVLTRNCPKTVNEIEILGKENL